MAMDQHQDFLDLEFWWLTRLGHPIEGQVDACVIDVPDYWDDESEANERVYGSVSVEGLGAWASKHRWESVHRELVVRTPSSSAGIAGPVLIDIDTREDRYPDRSPEPPDAYLDEARELVLRLLTYYGRRGIGEAARMVFFSGHKGFHIEMVMPDDPSMHSPDSFMAAWRCEYARVRDELEVDPDGDALIDRVSELKPWKRLNGSVNVWGPPDNPRRHRLTLIDERELTNLTARDLWDRSRA